MNPLRPWKIALVLALVFLAGGATGSVLTAITIQRGFERSVKFENWTARVTAHLAKRLNLAPEQLPRIRPIVEDTGNQLKRTVVKTMEDSWQIILQCTKRIDQELTAEQRTTHAEMAKKFRAELKKNFDLDLPEQ